MFVGPIMRETLATLESSSGRVELAVIGARKDPALTTLAVLLMSGVDWSAWMESIRTCGVWTATEYWTAVFGSIQDRKSTRLNSSHLVNSYAVFCLKKKK